MTLYRETAQQPSRTQAPQVQPRTGKGNGKTRSLLSLSSYPASMFLLLPFCGNLMQACVSIGSQLQKHEEQARENAHANSQAKKSWRTSTPVRTSKDSIQALEQRYYSYIGRLPISKRKEILTLYIYYDRIRM